MTTTEPTFELIPLNVQVRGEIVHSNLSDFCEGVRSYLAQIQRDLKTDADFGLAEVQVKHLSDTEAKVKLTKEKALAGALPLQQLLSALDDAAGEIRDARLNLEKQIKTRKETLKGELIAEYVAKIVHPWRDCYERNCQEAVKGKRTIETMRSALEKVSDGANKLLAENRATLAAFDKDHREILLEGKVRMEMELEDPALLVQRLGSLVTQARLAREREEAERKAKEATEALRASQGAKEIVKTPEEWCRIKGIEIIDPDGWSGPDGRSWEDCICETEFDRRAIRCTQKVHWQPAGNASEPPNHPWTPEQRAQFLKVLDTIEAGIKDMTPEQLQECMIKLSGAKIAKEPATEPLPESTLQLKTVLLTGQKATMAKILLDSFATIKAARARLTDPDTVKKTQVFAEGVGVLWNDFLQP